MALHYEIMSTLRSGTSRVASSLALLIAFTIAILPGVLVVRAGTTPSTTTEVVSPDPDWVGNPATCTATVTGSAGTPTGNVTFSSDKPGNGNFNSTSCTLQSGSCSVTWTPSANGEVKITAAYGGDSVYAGSSDTYKLKVNSSVPEFPVLLALPFVFIAGALIYLSLRRRITSIPTAGRPI